MTVTVTPHDRYGIARLGDTGGGEHKDCPEYAVVDVLEKRILERGFTFWEVHRALWRYLYPEGAAPAGEKQPA